MKKRINRIVSLVMVAAMLLCMRAPAFAAEEAYDSLPSRIGEVLSAGTVLTGLSTFIDEMFMPSDNVDGVTIKYYSDAADESTVTVTSEGISDIDEGNHTVFTLAEAVTTANDIMTAAFNGWEIGSQSLNGETGKYEISLIAKFVVPAGIAKEPENVVKSNISETRFSLDFNYSAANFPAFYSSLSNGTNDINITWYTTDRQPEIAFSDIAETSWNYASPILSVNDLSAGETSSVRSDEFTLTTKAEMKFTASSVGGENDVLEYTVYSGNEPVKTASQSGYKAEQVLWTLEPGTYTLGCSFTDESGNGEATIAQIGFAAVIQQKGINAGGANLDLSYSVENHPYYYNGFTTYCVAEIPMLNASGTPAAYTIRHTSPTVTLTLNETEYTATLNANGGTVDGVAAKEIKYVPSTGIPDMPTPIREGYHFVGWSDTDPNDPNSTVFPREYEFPFGAAISLTVYAWWQAEVYTLTYQTNGGVPIDDRTFTVESSVHFLPTPEKTGYTFLGWYTTPEFSSDAINKIPHGSMGSLTVYAKWEETIYTVIYEENGGTAVDDETYKITTGIPSLPTPVKDGYRFLGWYEKAAFSGNPVTSIPVGSSGQKNLYAKWELIMHTLSFNANGGVEVSPAEFAQLDGVSTLPDTTKLGCEFLGWYDNQDFSGNAVTSIPVNTESDVTLFAKWFENIYSIHYVTNGGEELASNHFTSLSGYSVLPIPERDNYAFIGWYSNEQLVGSAVTSIAPNTIAQDVTLYAKWEQEGFKVIYNTFGGDALEDDSFAASKGLDKLKEPTRTGYNFVGWFDNNELEGAKVTSIAAGTYSDVTLYAMWQPYIYSVAYIENGGATIINDSFIGINGLRTLKTTTRPGYTFDGWYESPSYSGSPVEYIPANTMRTVVLYAKWTLNTYTVVFNSNEGSAVSNITYTTVNGVSELPVTTRSGYTFLGWYNNAEFTGEPITSIPSGSVGDKTLYAKWQADNPSFFSKLMMAFSSFFSAIAQFFAGIFA